MASLSPETSSSPSFPGAEGDNLFSGFVGISLTPLPLFFQRLAISLDLFQNFLQGAERKVPSPSLAAQRGKPPKSIAVPLRGPCGGKRSYIPTPVGPLSRHAKEATNNLLGESPGGGEHREKRNVCRPERKNRERRESSVGVKRGHGKSHLKPTSSLNKRHENSVLDLRGKSSLKQVPRHPHALLGKF